MSYKNYSGRQKKKKGKKTLKKPGELGRIVSEQNVPNSLAYWDVRKEDKIEYFDPELSYELTGYRPITKTKGLDFNPAWFTETREYKQHGKYCPYLFTKSKKYDEFWERRIQKM